MIPLKINDPEHVFSDLLDLRFLDLSENMLSGNFPDLSRNFRLADLRFSQSEVGDWEITEIPEYLCDLYSNHALKRVDITDVRVNAECVPDCIFRISDDLFVGSTSWLLFASICPNMPAPPPPPPPAEEEGNSNHDGDIAAAVVVPVVVIGAVLAGMYIHNERKRGAGTDMEADPTVVENPINYAASPDPASSSDTAAHNDVSRMTELHVHYPNTVDHAPTQ